MKKFFRESTRPEDWEEVKTDVLVNSYDRTSFGDFKDRALKAGRIPSVKGSAASCLKRLGLSDGEFFNEAGALLFGKKPKLSLKLAVFATEYKLTFLDQKTEEGSIYKLVRLAENYIMSNIHWRAEIVGNEQYRLALLLEVLELAVALVLEEYVTDRESFVDYEYLGVNVDRNGKCETNEHT